MAEGMARVPFPSRSFGVEEGGQGCSMLPGSKSLLLLAATTSVAPLRGCLLRSCKVSCDVAELQPRTALHGDEAEVNGKLG
jgi:hypothetical protein